MVPLVPAPHVGVNFEFRLEEAAFPTEVVEIFDPSTGGMVSIEKPVGCACQKCDSALTDGIPYIENPIILEKCKTDPAMKAFCGDVVQAINSQTGGRGVDTCHSGRGWHRHVTFLEDGYDMDDFLDVFDGVSPEQMNIPPTQEVHPITGAAVTVYKVPARPSFRIETTLESKVRLSTNNMPHENYDGQARNTFDFFTDQQREETFGNNWTASAMTRKDFNRRLKGQIAKNRMSPGPTKSEHTGAAPIVAPTQRMASLPRAPTFHSAPSLSRSSSTSMQPPASWATPAAKSALSVYSGMVKFMTATTPPVRPASSALSMPEAASVPSTPRTSRFSIFTTSPGQCQSPAGGLKRPAAELKAPPVARQRSTAASPRDSPPSKSSSSVGGLVVDLAKLKGATFVKPDNDGRSVATSSRGDGENKFERAINAISLFSCFAGDNLEAELSQLKRMATVGKRESPDNFGPKCQQHHTIALGCQEIVLCKMMAQTGFGVILSQLKAIVDTGALHDNKVPKATLCDLTCVFQAMRFLQPWVKKPDLEGLLKALALEGAPSSPYNITEPTWHCEVMDADDIATGVVPTSFCNFFEKYVIAKMLRNTDASRPLLDSFLCKHFIPYLQGLHEDNRPPIIQALTKRCLGVLFVIGALPYELNASLEDVTFLSHDKDHIVFKAMQQSPWAKALFDTCFLNHAGERICWPKVLDAVARIESGQGPDLHLFVDEAIKDSVAWSLQCRDSALPKFFRPAVFSWMRSRFETLGTPCEDNENERKFDHRDEATVRFISTCQLVKSNQWQSDEIEGYLSKLKSVVASLEESTTSSKISSVFSDQLSAPKEGRLEQMARAVNDVMPENTQSKVLICGEDRGACVTSMLEFASEALKAWPTTDDSILRCCVNIVTRIQISTEPALGDAVSKRLQEAKDLLVHFRRCQGWINHLTMFTKVVPITAEVVEDNKIITLARKLKVYETHYQDDKAVVQFFSEDGKSMFDSHMASTTAYISEFKNLFVQNSLAPLKSELDNLKQVAGGSSDGHLWTTGIAERATSWTKFYKDTESTLRAVDGVAIRALVRSVDQVSLDKTVCVRRILLMPDNHTLII